eukprot:6209257-Pleurochrysis_carterae.AAC.1
MATVRQQESRGKKHSERRAMPDCRTNQQVYSIQRVARLGAQVRHEVFESLQRLKVWTYVRGSLKSYGV